MVPGGRPVVQVCGLCSNSALALCVETGWPVLFLPGQSCADGIPMHPEKHNLLRDVCHLSPDTLWPVSRLRESSHHLWVVVGCGGMRNRLSAQEPGLQGCRVDRGPGFMGKDVEWWRR